MRGAAALVLLLTTPAHAQRMGIERPERETPAPAPRPDEPPRPPEPPPTGWYGLPAVIMDGAAVGLVLTGAALETPAPAIAGVATYALGAPINHLAHGRGRRAIGSLSLRLLPALLAFPFLEESIHELNGDTSRPGSGSCRSNCVAFSALAFGGPVVAMVIDDVWLARWPEPAATAGGGGRSAGRAEARRAAWAPQVSPLPGGGWSVGAAGRF